MTINGVKVVISYDSDIDLFRGEFIGLNGGADFYASDAEGLRRQGEISLKVFMDACKEDGVDPIKTYSGKFVLRISPDDHAAASIAATSSGKSLNQWASEVLKQAVNRRVILKQTGTDPRSHFIIEMIKTDPGVPLSHISYLYSRLHL